MNRHNTAAQRCVFVVVSYSNRVTMVARQDGHDMVVGSGPTWGLEMMTVVGSVIVESGNGDDFRARLLLYGEFDEVGGAYGLGC